MKSTLKDEAGKNLLVESTIFTGNPSGAKGNFREQIFARDCNNSGETEEVLFFQQRISIIVDSVYD